MIPLRFTFDKIHHTDTPEDTVALALKAGITDQSTSLNLGRRVWNNFQFLVENLIYHINYVVL